MHTHRVSLVLLLTLLGTPSCLFNQGSSGSGLRPFIQQLVDSLARGDLEGSNLNMMGRKPISSSQYGRYETLRDSATLDELVQLAGHASPVVRCYTFDALVERKAPGFFELAKQHFADTAVVRVHFFDVISFERVAGYIRSRSLRWYLETSTPDSANYAYIRELARTKEVPEAVIALARFRRAGDEDVILSYFDSPRDRFLAPIAAREFPSERMFRKLAEVHKQMLSEDFPSLHMLAPLYQAIVQYKTPEALRMLTAGLREPKDFGASLHKISIYIAVKKYPDNYFQGILDRIELSPQEKEAAEEMMKE